MAAVTFGFCAFFTDVISVGVLVEFQFFISFINHMERFTTITVVS